MAIGKSDSVHYQNIADSIRRNLSGTEGAGESYSPSEMAGGVDAVADHNYRKGYDDSEKSAKNAVRGLARRVFGEERETTVGEVADQALSDFSSIKFELNNRGATVLDIEPTENYPEKIGIVYEKGAESGFARGKDVGIAEGFESGKQAGIAEGYNTGKAEGYNSGYLIGKVDGKAEVSAQIEPINTQLENTLNGTDTGGKSYYDEFWDLYQQNGKRTDYQYGGFAGIGWTDETYKPKYPVKPINAYGMYTGCRLTNILDVDTSIATSITNLFLVCPFLERVGIISAVLAREAANAFSYCTNLKTIDRFIVTEQTPYSNTFFNCTSLENLTIEGVIGQNGFDVQWSTKLSKASIISIINALSTTASGKSVTLSKVAVESAFGSTASEEWISLINARSNWTINLV